MRLPQGIINAINEAYRLRREIAMLTAYERELSETIKQFMTDTKSKVVETDTVTAEGYDRPTYIIDPNLLYDALNGNWNQFISTLTVRVDPNKKKDYKGARSYLGEQEIIQISKIIKVPILTLKRVTKTSSPKKSQTA